MPPPLERPTVYPLELEERERLRFLVETRGQFVVIAESGVSRVGLLQALSGSNVYAATREKIQAYLQSNEEKHGNEEEPGEV